MPSLDTIRRLSVRATSSGTQQVTAELNRVADAQDKVAASSEKAATVTETSSRRQMSVSRAWERLTADMEGAARAADRFAREQQTVERALQQGLATQEEASRAMAHIQSGYQDYGLRSANRLGIDQTDINGMLGIGGNGSSARASASVFEEAARAEEDMQRQAAALRAEIDPLGAAQAALNAQMARYRELAAAGAITSSELAAADLMTTQRMAALEAGTLGVAKGLTLNRAGMMELRAAGINSFQALASGMSVFQVASMEGAQVFGAFVQGTEGGLSAIAGQIGGAASALTAMVGGPIPAAAIALTAVGAAAASAFGDIEAKTIDSEAVMKEFKAVIEEIGRVSQETADRIKAMGELDPTLTGILAHVRQTRDDASYSLNSEIAKFEQAAQDFQSKAATLMQSANPMEAFQSGFSTSGVFSAIDEANRKIVDIGRGLEDGSMKAEDALDQLNRLSAANTYPTSLDDTLRKLEDIAKQAAESQRQMAALANLPAAGTTGRPHGASYFSDLGASLGSMADYQNRFGSDWKNKLTEGLNDQTVKLDPGPYGDFNIPTPTDRPSFESFAPKAASSAAGSSAYENATRSLQERTASIQAQIAAQDALTPALDDYGYSVDRAKASQDLLNAALRDHKQITPTLIDDIDRQAEAYARATAAQDRQREAERRAAEQLREDSDTWKTGISTFVSDLEQGKNAWQSFGDAATSVLDKVIGKIENNLSDALANAFSPSGASGGGFLSSIFSGIGSLFGGGAADPWAGLRGFAGGTENAPAGWAWVGEKGPELRRLRAGDVVRSHSRSMQMAANHNAAPQELHVYFHNSVDENGNITPVVERISGAKASQVTGAALKHFNDKVLPGRVNQIKKYPRQTG